MGEGVQGRDGRTLTCSRIGCDAVAVASFSFDALNELAWLDTVVEARGAGFLCQVHAERLTPPRGWSLLDRRSPEPMLYVAPAVLPDTAAPAPGRTPKKKRTTRARHPKNPPATEVEVETAKSGAVPAPAASPAATPAPAPAAPAAVEGEAELPFDNPPPMPTTWSARNLPALDEDVDDRTPLLARAFESLRQHEERRPGPEGPRGA
ncbi:MAG: DUF3499 family protein [Acidimicrobiia bacterium]